MAQVSLFGAARLTPQGMFEVYLGGMRGKPKYPMNNPILAEYIREMFDFLMSDDTSRVIGSTTVHKRTTRKREKQVWFSYLGNHRILLTRKQGQYASLIFELPFSRGMNANASGMLDEHQEVGNGFDAHDESEEVTYLNG